MSVKPTVTVSKDGPYLVSGAVPVQMQTITPNSEGGSWSWSSGRSFPAEAPYLLCRCGHSGNKPFCDGTHATVGFKGTEVADFDAEPTETIDGPDASLDDIQPLCAFARFCDNDGGIWSIVEESGATPVAVRQATNCPSGRLVLRKAPTGEAIEAEFLPSIGLVEDPLKECSGPLWVRGGISVVSADGKTYETRNRVTLCRCGMSQNKPFCDGTHADGFVDGL
jgi:CDGSH-type Zn-finger protein